MKHLARVQIGAQTWSIYLCAEKRLAEIMGEPCRGACFPTAQKIALIPHECLDAALDTWVHECAHAFIHAWGLDVKAEETRVRTMTPQVIATLRGLGMLKVPGWLRKTVHNGSR